MLLETDDYPARYFADDFPTEEQVAKIGEPEL
jgi:hypothetical protein